MSEFDVYGFVKELEELPELRACDKVFDVLYRFTIEDKIVACNQVLRAASESKLSRWVLRGMLVITLSAKEKLPARPELYLKVRAMFAEHHIESDVQRIIGRLE